MNIPRENFTGNLLIIGLGSIAKGVIPLFLRHLTITPDRIRIIATSVDKENFASVYGIACQQIALTKDNYRTVLEPQLKKGDFMVNLSVNVSSLALMALCRKKKALYLDTSIEPWEGGYTDETLSLSARSNYMLREQALAFGRQNRKGSTAVICQGANPGIVSAFLKQALLNIAADNGIVATPATREEWAELARQLSIKTVHVAERDTQSTNIRKPKGVFFNTWSIDGFIGESLQPSELGWGTHEKHWPEDAIVHETGCRAAIMLGMPGAAVRVRSWTPLEGPYLGFLITHNESISIADYLTIYENGQVIYRPTVHYAYHPCDDAILSLHELAGKNWREQPQKKLLRDEITEGTDELGILLMGNKKGVYWYGSHLSIKEARDLAPYNNATSLQVAAGVLAGVIYAIRHPEESVLEPDDIDHHAMLEIASPYLGEIIGRYSGWTPLEGRNWPLIENELDQNDPWQFKNIRVK
ncbi:MAG: saccharopine dehydrogenase NADP-binding domain-containing protein [Oxalobacter formigenes]|nr:saccharopine dehydrogenase NADP-binding domain-containing protein [Oxalobacter formigenes]